MDVVFGLLIEVVRVTGGGIRRHVFRIKWEDSNDGFDMAIGLLVLCSAVWLLISLALHAFS